VTLSAALLAKYAGLYWKTDENRSMRIVLKDGKLFLAPSAGDGMELKPLSDNRFQLLVYPVSVTFSEAKAGAPQHLAIQSPGEEKPDTFDLVPVQTDV
jgi:hypothetical protein